MDGQPLTERLVEHGIAGGIGEVREDQHIFVREGFGLLAMVPEVNPDSRQNEYGNGSDRVLRQRVVSLAG